MSSTLHGFINVIGRPVTLRLKIAHPLRHHLQRPHLRHRLKPQPFLRLLCSASTSTIPPSTASTSAPSEDIPHHPSNSDLLSIPHNAKPGVLDSSNFICGSSVSFWRDLSNEPPASSLSSLLRTLSLDTVRTPFSTVPAWLYSLGRLSLYTFLHTGMMSVRSQNVPTPPSLERFREALYAVNDDIQRSVQHRLYNLPLPNLKLNRIVQENLAILGELQDMRNGMRMKKRHVWMENGLLYPKYYTYGFHYQPDGWMSSRSAKAYDTLTEILFMGRQDAMQRVTFIPLQKYLRNHKTTTTTTTTTKDKTQVIEIGAGTGRLATTIRKTYPDICLTVSDLSAFMLERARFTMSENEHTHFVQANAEQLPFEKESAHVVYSVYLMHELPPSARENFIREAYRVLRKNGALIITDSVQLGDRPQWDKNLGKFGNLNEPWYASYVATDLAQLCDRVTDGGLKADMKEMCSATKCLSFVKVK